LLVQLVSPYLDDPIIQEKVKNNLNAAKLTLAKFEQMKVAVRDYLYPNGIQLVNRIIKWLADLIKKAELTTEGMLQNKRAADAKAAADAAAGPQIQTNYLITLKNPVEASILIGILNNTGMMHIRKSHENYSVLSTGPWGNNIKPQSTKGDGYIDRLDLLKLPIKPNQVVTVNRKMLEAGMDEYGSGYRLTFTHRTNKKVMIELDLGSPISIMDVDVDRPLSNIKDIGRNITYSATVTTN
jgi:hypothetical protein